MRIHGFILVLFLSSLLLMGCQPFDSFFTTENAVQREAIDVPKSIEERTSEKVLFSLEVEIDEHIAEIDEETDTVVVSNPDSIEVMVNKQRRLPEGYEPTDLVDPNVSHAVGQGDPRRLMRAEAAEALESLFAHAESEGLELVAVSGYRSYDRQKVIYENNVAARGQEHADQFSARPGTSEHQTGLAMDISAASVALALDQAFEQTSEGSWVAEHAHLHGFILRYPDGKTDITGYAYEPWHFRYVGEELATEIYEKDLTLEEYFGYGY
ncbi:LAS superfamily LD-carboxypeptidase LdcB [Natronobacillus azotifigens]|uniref:M15 family metallopeptidase n=1 Tax=Natronobacillus azotifigens TaxID=472978 RepID=A0A9J6R8U7_9BACI|nr:M15 family metallopeptidase [Natronobacillus azotifigens]MCZ0702056.1 M15 family metallopeptidase [Natronobacillus azotifigens]